MALRHGFPLIALAIACIPAAALADPVRTLSALPAASPADADIILPLRDEAGLESLTHQQQDPSSPQFHRWLTPAQFNERFGPDAATVARIVEGFRASGLSVVQNGRLLNVRGTVAALGVGLGTHLANGITAAGQQRMVAVTTPVLPDAVRAAGGTLIGLGQQEHEFHTLSHHVAVPASALASPRNRVSGTGPYWYGDLKQAYQYPSYQTMITRNGVQQRLDGTGATIGILISGDVYDSDIDLLFNHEQFRAHSGQSANPRLFKRVMINGGATTSSGGFGEASLDVQEALTGAPGAHVILYGIPTLADKNIVDGYARIIADNEADIVSSSFGGCELAYTPAYNSGVDDTTELRLYHQLFLQGNAQGITFIASSGDEAGLECPSANYATGKGNGTFVPSVSTPAADPSVTAVGGTNVVTNFKAGSLDSIYLRENAYIDPEGPSDPYSLGALVTGGAWGPGGGPSAVYAKPAYQTVAGLNTGSTTFRAVPDIGMQVGGCPSGAASGTTCNGGNSPLNGNGNTERSSVIIAENGSFGGVIGTSVAAPEFAGAVALLVERHGRMGNLNPYLYQLGTAQTASGSNNAARATTVYHRSIPGYNGVVTNNQPVNTKGAYYNYTVGNGTPVIYRLVDAPDAAPMGAPQTASNP